MKTKFAKIMPYWPVLSMVIIAAVVFAVGSHAHASSAAPASRRSSASAIQRNKPGALVPNAAVTSTPLTAMTTQAGDRLNFNSDNPGAVVPETAVTSTPLTAMTTQAGDRLNFNSDNPGAVVPDTAVTSTLLTAMATQAGDTLNFGSLKLVNNQWGAPPDENLTSSIFLDQGKTFGWYWNRQDPKTKPGNTSAQPIYPSIRIGGNHVEQSNLSCFPIKLSEIKSLNILASYDYSATPTGAFNLAYDMFLLDTNKSGPHAVRKAEIMIWMHATIGQPSQDYKGDFTDGHNAYKLYSHTMSDGRLYAAFVMEGQPQFQARHTVDIKRLVDNLNLDSNWYIPGIELGNEIVSGSGKIEISQFSVNLNGSAIE